VPGFARHGSDGANLSGFILLYNVRLQLVTLRLGMGSEGGVRPRWLWNGILEPSTDFYGLMNQHASKVLGGVEALRDWMLDHERDERFQRLRDVENEADQLKLELGRKLFESFITPFDREDIFEIVMRMDEVVNAAKSTAREIDAFDVEPRDAPNIDGLLEILIEGTNHLVQAIGALRTDLPLASAQALLARKAENRFTKAYRATMKALFEDDDIKKILRLQEVYKQMLNAAEKIDLVGERLQHSVIKMS
jgi:uncharacterized protein Yka (UPF0111/DUF47 family)